MELDILAVGAHPDDVELSCGGTIAKCAKLGYKVGVLDLTEGEMGTRGSKEVRSKEATDAAKILGVKIRENLNLGDGGFEVNRATRLKVIQAYRRFRPRILLIPPPRERHPDHEHAHVLAKEAWFYSGLTKIETTFSGKKQEPWRPHTYYCFMQTFEFTPTFIVDISDVYDKRLAALKAFSSQFYNPASKEPKTFLSTQSFQDLLETRMKYYGQKIGVQYGEPYLSVDTPGISNILDIKSSGG